VLISEIFDQLTAAMPDDIQNVALGNSPIQIPSEFPGILKQYTKAAIRTQPRDLLLWSAAYFRCMARGEPPPAKDRLEYPVPQTESGLTPGLLRVIHKQVGHQTKVSQAVLADKWRGVCLNQVDLDHLLLDGGWKRGEVDWLRFVGLASMTISDGVRATLSSICEILSDSPDGTSANIKFETFREVYSYLSERNPEVELADVEAVLDYMEKVSKKQKGFVNPANFKAPDCPKL